MRTCLKWLGIVCLAAATGGCAVGWTSNNPYPTYGNPVNPTPVAGYRVECATVEQLGYPLFDNFTTSCDQVIAPAYRSVVIQTKG